MVLKLEGFIDSQVFGRKKFLILWDECFRNVNMYRLFTQEAMLDTIF